MRLAACIPAASLAAALGCETYRVEYHKRPAYYKAAGVQDEDRVTLEDGTVLVFTTRDSPDSLDFSSGGAVSGSGDERPVFQIREELDDGTVVLRAMLPQHVLANTLTCLRNQEYDLIWEQLLSEQMHRNYELRGQGFEEFEEFWAANRMELAAMLTRMMLGLSRGEAYMENVGGGVVRFYFHPRVAPVFKFKTVEVIAEGGGMKLLIIR